MELTPKDIRRFMKYYVPLGKAQCWPWLGSRRPSGYGQFAVWRGKRGSPPQGAHRIAWLVHCGPIPPGAYVCHRCDHPPCVNPDHLFLGSPSDNMADAGRKGRLSWRAKPVAPASAELWGQVTARGWTDSEFARRAGVTRQRISQVRIGGASEAVLARLTAVLA